MVIDMETAKSIACDLITEGAHDVEEDTIAECVGECLSDTNPSADELDEARAKVRQVLNTARINIEFIGE